MSQTELYQKLKAAEDQIDDEAKPIPEDKFLNDLMDKYENDQKAEDKIIDEVAQRVLIKYRKAFEALAK